MHPPALATGTPVPALAARWWDALLDALSPKRKLLRDFRARWGARGDKSGFLASRYFERVREAPHAIVLVTSHDVELQALLDGVYALYHFQENPEVEGYFDYQLRPGPATGRNAIRLLERLGFPHEITANAFAYANPGGTPTSAGTSTHASQA